LRERPKTLAHVRRRFGYRRLFILLRREGERAGRNRIQRLYREEGLSVRKCRSRQLAMGTRVPILMESGANAHWLVNFGHDQMTIGSFFRIFNIVDAVTRESLATMPDANDIRGQHGAPRRYSNRPARFGR
jgi:putative transposase